MSALKCAIFQPNRVNGEETAVQTNNFSKFRTFQNPGFWGKSGILEKSGITEKREFNAPNRIYIHNQVHRPPKHIQTVQTRKTGNSGIRSWHIPECEAGFRNSGILSPEN